MRNNFNSLVPFAQIVDDLFGKTFGDLSGGSVFKPQVPALNVKNLDKEYILELAAPGLEKSDFKIQIDDNVLSISVEKQKEKSEEKENFSRKEFSYHSFKRALELPQNVNAEAIEARYDNGILFVHVPKVVELNKNVKSIQIK